MKFIPRPVVLGFTNGIALLIASTQIKDFLGLRDAGTAERVLRADARVWRATCRPSNPAARRRSASASLALVLLVPTLAAAHARIDRGAGRRHGRRRRCSVCRSRRSARRFGGIPSGLPAVAIPAFRADLDPAAAAVGADGRASGRGREPALGGRRRLDDRRSAQLERRAAGAGRRQPRRRRSSAASR